MRTRLLVAGVAAFMVLGGAVAVAQSTATDVQCTITDKVLSCPLPDSPPVTVTETAPAVTQTVTVTASPVTVTATPASSSTSTPPPATGVNCAPNPSACGYPDATNTGAKGTLRKVPEEVTSGPGWTWNASGKYIRANSNGAVIDRVQCACSVDVNANSVTISNSKLTFSGEWFGVAIRHASNTLIVDSTIGAAPGTERMLAGIKNIYGDETGTTVRRVDISNVSTGVQIDSGLIEDSYIHDLGFKSGDHLNGTTSNGGTTLLTIRHNTVFNQVGQTDAISLFQDFGAQRNRVIESNLIAGGGYTLYAGANAGKEANATQIVVRNNRFSNKFFPKAGSFGPYTAWNPTGAGNVWSGNVWDHDNSPLN